MSDQEQAVQSENPVPSTEQDRGDHFEPEKEPVKDSLSEAEADLDKEGEETAEEKAQREAEEAAAEAKKRIRIPKARFDEAMTKAREREKALQAEIERLQGAQQERQYGADLGAMRSKIEELSDKYEDLIMEGMKEEARKVRRELDALRDQFNDASVAVKTQAVRKQTLDTLSYERALDEVERKHPVLNPDAPEFDAAKANEVADLMDALIAKGRNRAQALAQAVKYVVGAVVEKPTAPARAVEARTRAADADKRQPPAAAAVGKPSDQGGLRDGNPGKLTQAQFDRLDEATIARLRGDDF